MSNIKKYIIDYDWKASIEIEIDHDVSKRTARAVLTGMCYSAGSAMRHGSSSLTRLTGQSAMTPSTWRR
ncbi:single stranded DNA-binding protein [Escherichia coli]|nr:single stranded DNA-binding protein [Escherichia coli]